MAQAKAAATDAGFSETCWRGLCFGHPADWEEAGLSGPNGPGQIILADRRFQRLQVQWQVLKRPPDLARMYEQLKEKTKDKGRTEPLAGAPGWTGLLRREKQGLIVHAGKYFQDSAHLVQAVFVWPEGRDARVERALLDSIAPQQESALVRWQALGLSAVVPKEFELAASSSLVGRIAWEFRRSARPAMGLLIERIAMPCYWLKSPLEDWLAGEAPEGFRPLDKKETELAGHAGARVLSRRGNVLAQLVHAAIARSDWAWRCGQQERVYRVSCWRRSAHAIDWPAGLEVRCCRAVAPRRS